MAMMSITFNADGTVGLYASDNGVRLSVDAPINQLQSVLPAATFDRLRELTAALLDATLQAPRLRKVN